MNLTNDSLCDNDTAMISVCSGTGVYSSRTYTWYDVDGLGRQIYLSNVNVLTPTFNPPTVTSNTIFRYALQVNRGGCVNEDTMSFIVKASPLPFDVMDDTICNDTCIILTAPTLQFGITYNVYDGLGSWLGTLPYLACPNSTSTYYFEAIDSSSTCAQIRDTAVITVVPKGNPGISNVITNCGSGCIINLFDSLGGTPDTNGIWLSPNGSLFSASYNATFNGNTNPSGAYSYVLSNSPCGDTISTITIRDISDTLRFNVIEDSLITVCPPVIKNFGVTSSVCSPSKGTVTIDTASGCMTYAPDTNYIGIDTLCIQTCNSSGVCDTTLIVMTIIPSSMAQQRMYLLQRVMVAMHV